MMEIILSRLEDQPTNQGHFEVKLESKYVLLCLEYGKKKYSPKCGGKRYSPGAGCQLPGDLGNAPTRGRHSSPQNPGELENWKAGDQGAFSGGGGGAPLWQADAAEGSWALQGHQAHLQ